jgi:hypothetical protein
MLNKGKKDKKSAGAGKKSDGNVLVDLGEKHTQKIDRMISTKLAEAGVRTVGRSAATAPKASGSGPARWTPAAAKPAAMGSSKGFQPWYSKFGKPWLGQGGSAVTVYPGERFKILPRDLEQSGAKLFGGMGLGLIGNRAIVRITPLLWQNNSKLVHEGIAFVAGLVPLLFKRNAMTVGAAVPGAIMLGATVLDALFNWLGMPKSNLQGVGDLTPRQHIDATAAARNKLNSVQQNVNRALGQAQPQQSQPQRTLPRVVAV